MKKVSILSFILLCMLSVIACSNRRTISDSQRQLSPAADDVYNQTTVYEQPAPVPDPASYEVFYDDLSPYGSWIDYPEYGYVWIPRVSADFHPYATEGHWVMTDYGWTWVSDYRWGWAAFHYGRWAYEPRYGWLWVPGRVWGPAWVAWRESDEYFGWAPMGPYANISINVACPYDHYRFVPRRYFTHRNVYNYYADRHNNVTIINHTTYINETHMVNKNKYYYGPRRDFVEKATGQKVHSAKVYDNPKPDADAVDNDRVKVYRPRIENVSTGARKPVPKKVVPTTDLQPIPDDRRLTPNVKRERPQNTEGGELRPQDKPDVVKPPRRDDIQKNKPDVVKPPRRENMPQNKPDVIKPPKVEQPRKEKVNPLPTRDKEVPPPPKRKNKDNNN